MPRTSWRTARPTSSVAPVPSKGEESCHGVVSQFPRTAYVGAIAATFAKHRRNVGIPSGEFAQSPVNTMRSGRSASTSPGSRPSRRSTASEWMSERCTRRIGADPAASFPLSTRVCVVSGQ